MRRGKSQLTIKRAMFLANEARKIPIGTASVMSPRELIDLLERNDLSTPGKQHVLSTKNVLRSICGEVNRIGKGWVFAFPGGGHSGYVALYNAFSEDVPQTRNKRPDPSTWRAFATPRMNPQPSERYEIAERTCQEALAQHRR